VAAGSAFKFKPDPFTFTLMTQRTRQLPDWLKAPLPGGEKYLRLKSLVREHGLHTVCESASCPNRGECWNSGTLTLMILGGSCTRACRFCDVPTGKMNPPDSSEPEQVAEMLSRLDLKHAVITSVDRDDLPDGGAGHWVETLKRIREACPQLKVEALIPDFGGEVKWIAKVCEAAPDVLAHNVETVPTLQASVRPQCSYAWSLKTLTVSAQDYGLLTKSSMMLGLGEKKEEVVRTLDDLRATGTRMLTLGQYLRPTLKHLEVVEYVHPDVFAEYKEIGEAMGLKVESGPRVRSSYLADRQTAEFFLIGDERNS
jgi:lipoic acid synthetase